MKILNRTFPFSNVHVLEAPSVPVWCLASVLDNKDRPAHDTAVHFVRSVEGSLRGSMQRHMSWTARASASGIRTSWR